MSAPEEHPMVLCSFTDHHKTGGAHEMCHMVALNLHFLSIYLNCCLTELFLILRFHLGVSFRLIVCLCFSVTEQQWMAVSGECVWDRSSIYLVKWISSTFICWFYACSTIRRRIKGSNRLTYGAHKHSRHSESSRSLSWTCLSFLTGSYMPQRGVSDTWTHFYCQYK